MGPGRIEVNLFLVEGTEYTPRSLASAAKRALANGPLHPMLGRREVEGREEE